MGIEITPRDISSVYISFFYFKEKGFFSFARNILDFKKTLICVCVYPIRQKMLPHATQHQNFLVITNCLRDDASKTIQERQYFQNHLREMTLPKPFMGHIIQVVTHRHHQQGHGTLVHKFEGFVYWRMTRPRKREFKLSSFDI